MGSTSDTARRLGRRGGAPRRRLGAHRANVDRHECHVGRGGRVPDRRPSQSGRRRLSGPRLRLVPRDSDRERHRHRRFNRATAWPAPRRASTGGHGHRSPACRLPCSSPRADIRQPAPSTATFAVNQTRDYIPAVSFSCDGATFTRVAPPSPLHGTDAVLSRRVQFGRCVCRRVRPSLAVSAANRAMFVRHATCQRRRWRDGVGTSSVPRPGRQRADRHLPREPNARGRQHFDASRHTPPRLDFARHHRHGTPTARFVLHGDGDERHDGNGAIAPRTDGLSSDGLLMQETAFTLPSTATMVAATTGYIPYMGIMTTASP